MELYPQTYISWLSDIWWEKIKTHNNILELYHAPPTPHLINGVGMTKERSSRQLLKERPGLQLESGLQLFFHMQQTQISPILLPNRNYVPYHTLMSFDKGDKEMV